MSAERGGAVPGARPRLGTPQYYGPILFLIVTSFAFGIAAADQKWGAFIYVLLQAATLLLALRASDASARSLRVSTALVAAVLIGSAIGSVLGTERFTQGLTGVVGAGLAFTAIIAIGRETARHPDVSGRTVMGALCIYLLVGLFFAYVYQLIGAAGSSGFFESQGDGTPSDYLYFSYITQATVGYGDFVAHGNLGRSFAVLEAIVGQLYLVTVVGITVGNFARRPRADESGSR